MYGEGMVVLRPDTLRARGTSPDTAHPNARCCKQWMTQSSMPKALALKLGANHGQGLKPTQANWDRRSLVPKRSIVGHSAG